MKNEIKTKSLKSETSELIKFYAVDENGKEIFCAEASLLRFRDFLNKAIWRKWELNYPLGGINDLENFKIKLAVYNRALEFMEKLENGIICPSCGVIKFEKEDIENIEENGECMVCDKIREEQFDDFKTDEEFLDDIL